MPAGSLETLWVRLAFYRSFKETFILETHQRLPARPDSWRLLRSMDRLHLLVLRLLWDRALSGCMPGPHVLTACSGVWCASITSCHQCPGCSPAGLPPPTALAGDHWAAIVCAAYTFLGFWFVGGLTALHGYLVSTNQTTYEHFRHRYSGGQLPCLLLLRLRLRLRLQLQNGKCPGGPVAGGRGLDAGRLLCSSSWQPDVATGSDSLVLLCGWAACCDGVTRHCLLRCPANCLLTCSAAPGPAPPCRSRPRQPIQPRLAGQLCRGVLHAHPATLGPAGHAAACRGSRGSGCGGRSRAAGGGGRHGCTPWGGRRGADGAAAAC